LRSARKLLDLLHEAIARLEGTEPLGSRLARVLDAARAACPIAAAAIRDERDAVLAGFEQGEGTRPVPARLLSIQTLLPRGTVVDSRESEDAPLPVDGARLELSAGSRRIGWLDLWGNGRPATAQARRLLSDVARLIALELLLSQPGAAAARLP
jgi:hypothetical protein